MLRFAAFALIFALGLTALDQRVPLWKIRRPAAETTFYTGTTRNVTCSGTITTALQDAVNASSDLDVVSIGAGSCTSGRITWTNKNIKVMGAGKTQTNITMTAGAFAITISNATKAKFRITGLHMTGASCSNSIIFINAENATSFSSGYRIDNNHIDYSAACSNDPILGWGVQYGVFDNNTVDLANATNILYAFFQTGLGESTFGTPAVNDVGGWYNLSLPSQYGTDAAVFFEDNVFNVGNTGSPRACYDASSGGARLVWRYNQSTGCYLYNHWVRRNDLDVFQCEVYNNTFTGNSWGNDSGEIWFRSESGTCVVYNNTISGFSGASDIYVDDRRAEGIEADTGQFLACDGTRAWDGNAGDPAAPGWPCLAQIGQGFGKTYAQITSGDKLPNLPFYAWNNGTQAGCSTGGACTNSINIAEYFGGAGSNYVKGTAHPNGWFDFVNNGTTPMPGYTAYTYPHPLRSARN